MLTDLPKPNPGESKEEYVARVIANAPAVTESPVTADAAEAAWEALLSSHVGTVEKCCVGRTLDLVHINLASYNTSVRKFEGQDHIVVPVVMLTEGVHAGSRGPIFYPAEEISKFPGAWNGVPIPVYHPEEGGFPVSANSPEILEAKCVGRVFRARTVENGKKLKAEIWFNIQKLSVLDAGLLTKLNSKEPIEVSTGLFMEEEETPGTWNGEAYMAVARNFRPDHLAVLPTGTGACSLMDGCGIRANSSTFDYQEAYLRLICNGEMSFRDIEMAIRQQILDPMDIYQERPTGSYRESYYLKEVWSDYFIYGKEVTGNPDRSFRQEYAVDADGTIKLKDSPVEVKRETKWMPVTNMTNKNSKQEGGSTVMNKEEKIQWLLANGCTLEKGILDRHEEVSLDFLINSMKETTEAKKKKDEAETAMQNAQAEIETIKTENVELKANAKPEPPKTVDEYLAQAPEEIRMTMNRAMARERQVKRDMVTALVKNQKVYTEEELNGMSVENLEKLTALAVPKNYSLKGATPVDPLAANTEEPLMVPTFNFAQ